MNDELGRFLEAFSLPAIEDRLPRDFFFKHGLRFPQQYGIACRDVTGCVQRAEALGAGPFIHATVAAPNWTERGERRRGCRLEVALGYAGDTQIEFLGPGRGTEFYAEAIREKDITFHHVGIYQRGMEQLAASLMDAGYSNIVRGGITLKNALSFDFRYFDTREEYSVYVELLDFHCLGMEIPMESLIRAYAASVRAYRRTRP